jgi:mRNA-degrading endonuclease RelE of RelBE toxin-antitoxin system
VEIVETRAFTTRLRALLPDDTYRRLQEQLVADPEAGTKIAGTGGLRKLRWSQPGRGKRGGVRVIYFWHPATERILMLFLFSKNEQDDLSMEQRRALRALIEMEYP